MWFAVYQQQWQVQDFPENGGAKPKGGGGGTLTYYFGHFSRKLHQIEKKVDPGSRIPSAPP